MVTVIWGIPREKERNGHRDMGISREKRDGCSIRERGRRRGVLRNKGEGVTLREGRVI